MPTFFDHLAALRSTLLRCIFAVVLGAALAHYEHEAIIAFLLGPIRGQKLFFLSPLDPLFFILKTDFLVGVVLALPFINWCLFSFVRPALKPASLLLLATVYLTSAVLILAALAYAYFVLVPISLGFLLGITVPGVDNLITATSYLNFLMVQSLITAVLFQIPLFIVAGAFVGALEMNTLAAKRRYIYVIGLAVLAIVTPTTDIFNLGIVAMPACLLFEGSLVIGRIVRWVRHRGEPPRL
jgi:sec-independent protein translocase protein TatC